MASTEVACVQALKPDLNTIPDELLLKILAFVPYPGPTLPDKPIAIKQHDTLKLVSSRFNSILSTNAFKIELLRCQYKDDIQLYGIESIRTNTELRDIVTRSTKIDTLVERMMTRNDSENIRSMLRLGILVLDYLKTAKTYSTKKAWMILIGWANETVFSSQFREILRFTLARLQGTFVTDSLDPITVDAMPLISDLEEADDRYEIVKSMHKLFKYRAFETAVLLDSRPLSLLTTTGPKFRKVLRQARAEHECLSNLYTIHAISMAFPEAPFGLDENQQAKDVKYIDGHQWRLLSPRAAKRSSDFKPTVNIAFNDIMDTLAEELTLELWQVRAYYRSSHAAAELLDIDLKAVGKFLRSAGNKIESKNNGIPKEILKRAQEVDLLRGMTDNATNEDEDSDEEYEQEEEYGEGDDEDV